MPRYPDRQSPRVKWFDYRSAGRYAVTICTQNRDHAFGEIREKRMFFNGVGRIARTLWYSLPDRFPGICLDAFVLMPNHLHGILVIPSAQLTHENMPERFQPSMRALMQEHHPELQAYQPPSLGKIIRAYKGAATYQIRQSGAKNFVWQDRYWSSILSTKMILQHARRYIYENPQNWEKDALHKA
jgi:putative transposase